ncbi:MAG: VOC family protein [Thermoleophilaceae bacterium]|nr:VOC family protein [Thermoleophilaceae bacterium]
MEAGGQKRLQITGIHHVTLICASLERSAPFYRDVLGLRIVEETVNEDDPTARHFFFGDAAGAPGTVVSLIEYPQMEEARVGRGGTHHLALSVESAEELEGWRAWLGSQGVQATEVLDRTYFHSIYLRDPDGHIIEIATRGPGFGPRVESSQLA